MDTSQIRPIQPILGHRTHVYHSLTPAEHENLSILFAGKPSTLKCRSECHPSMPKHWQICQILSPTFQTSDLVNFFRPFSCISNLLKSRCSFVEGKYFLTTWQFREAFAGKHRRLIVPCHKVEQEVVKEVKNLRSTSNWHRMFCEMFHL